MFRNDAICAKPSIKMTVGKIINLNQITEVKGKIAQCAAKLRFIYQLMLQNLIRTKSYRFEVPL